MSKEIRGDIFRFLFNYVFFNPQNYSFTLTLQSNFQKIKSRLC